MKNIFKLFVVVLFVSLFSLSSVFAEEVDPKSEGIIIANVNIYNAEIVSHEDNVFNISFDLSNDEMVQTGVQYGVRLVKQTDKGQFLIDEKIYDESLTLAENTTIKKEVTYTAPSGISGNYTIFLTSINENGLLLAMIPIGEASLTSSTKGLEIYPETCSLTVVGEEGNKKYSLNQGVDISESESLKLTCKVRNTGEKLIEMTPFFETHYRNTAGEIVADADGDTNPMIIAPLEEKEINFILPKALEPQAYDVVASLKYGEEYSNKIIVHYVLQGMSATIQNLSLDKDYYNKGDEATLSFFWSASADSFPGSRIGSSSIDVSRVVLSAYILNGYGRKCAKPIEKSIDSGTPVVEVPVSITSKCIDPKLSVTLKDESGKILTEKTFNVESTTNPKQPLSGIMIIVVILILIVIIGLYLKKKNNGSIPMGVFFLVITLVALGGLMPTRKASAQVIVLDNTTFTFSINKMNYAPSENIIAYGTMSSTVCGNTGETKPSLSAAGEYGSVSFSGSITQGTLTGPSLPGSYYIQFTLESAIHNFLNYDMLYKVIAPLPAPTVTVRKKSTSSIPYLGQDIITWESANAITCNKCTMTNSNVNKSCPGFNAGKTGSFTTEPLPENTTFTIECYN